MSSAGAGPNDAAAHQPGGAQTGAGTGRGSQRPGGTGRNGRITQEDVQAAAAGSGDDAAAQA